VANERDRRGTGSRFKLSRDPRHLLGQASGEGTNFGDPGHAVARGSDRAPDTQGVVVASKSGLGILLGELAAYAGWQ
jgi:hypothetical protein